MRNTQWKTPFAQLQRPRFARIPQHFVGAVPLRAEMDPKVGQEVLLCLAAVPDESERLAAVNPRLTFSVSALSGPSGAVVCILVTIQDPEHNSATISAWEVHLDPHDTNGCTPWLELAEQSHWHVCIMVRTERLRLLHFPEYSNGFTIDGRLPMLLEQGRGYRRGDFARARAEFMLGWSREDLLACRDHPIPDDPLAAAADALHAAIRKKNNDAVRTVGRELNERGGFTLMQIVHREVVQRHRHSARLVEMLWTGIGDWRG